MGNSRVDLRCFLILAGLLVISLPAAAQDSGGDQPLPIRIQLSSYIYDSRLAPGALAIARQAALQTTPSPGDPPQVLQPALTFTDNMQVEVEFQVEGRDPVRVATAPFAGVAANLVIPSDLPPGPTNTAFVIDGVIQELEPFTLDPYAPTLPSAQRIYQGPVLAQNYPNGVIALVGHTNPAVPDEWVTLWLTGLNHAATSDVTVRIADQQVAVDFAGASGIPGVDQINFRMPAHPYLGCYVPIEVDVAGYRSNRASIATSDGEGDCKHPLGLSHEDLAALDTYLSSSAPLGGALPRIGQISFSRYLGPSSLAGSTDDLRESINANLRPLGPSSAISLAGLQMPDSMRFGCQGTTLGLSAGIGGGFYYVSRADSPPGPPSFTGPNGQQIQIDPQGASNGTLLPFYTFSATNADPPTFTPGFWFVSVPEGDGLLAFQEAFRLPPFPQLLGDSAAPSTFTRNGDNLVEWDTSGYQPSDMIQVQITPPARLVTRIARATDGRLSVPGELLFASPGSQYPNTQSNAAPLSIQAIPYPPDRTVFYMPLTDGSFGRGVFDYRLAGAARDVTFE